MSKPYNATSKQKLMSLVTNKGEVPPDRSEHELMIMQRIKKQQAQIRSRMEQKHSVLHASKLTAEDKAFNMILDCNGFDVDDYDQSIRCNPVDANGTMLPLSPSSHQRGLSDSMGSTEQYTPPITHLEIFQIPGYNRLLAIDRFPHLQSLCVILQRIPMIENLHLAVNLQVLHLEDNQLGSLRGLDSCRALRELHVARNRLHTLEGVGQLPNLEILDVSDNCLSSLHAELLQCGRLRTLNVANNNLSSFARQWGAFPVLGRMHSLQELNLSGNALCSAEEVLCLLTALPHLRRLWLAHADYGTNPVCGLPHYNALCAWALHEREHRVGVGVGVRSVQEVSRMAVPALEPGDSDDPIVWRPLEVLDGQRVLTCGAMGEEPPAAHTHAHMTAGGAAGDSARQWTQAQGAAVDAQQARRAAAVQTRHAVRHTAFAAALSRHGDDVSDNAGARAAALRAALARITARVLDVGHAAAATLRSGNSDVEHGVAVVPLPPVPASSTHTPTHAPARTPSQRSTLAFPQWLGAWALPGDHQSTSSSPASPTPLTAPAENMAGASAPAASAMGAEAEAAKAGEGVEGVSGICSAEEWALLRAVATLCPLAGGGGSAGGAGAGREGTSDAVADLSATALCAQWDATAAAADVMIATEGVVEATKGPDAQSVSHTAVLLSPAAVSYARAQSSHVSPLTHTLTPTLPPDARAVVAQALSALDTLLHTARSLTPGVGGTHNTHDAQTVPLAALRERLLRAQLAAAAREDLAELYALSSFSLEHCVPNQPLLLMPARAYVAAALTHALAASIPAHASPQGTNRRGNGNGNQAGPVCPLPASAPAQLARALACSPLAPVVYSSAALPIAADATAIESAGTHASLPAWAVALAHFHAHPSHYCARGSLWSAASLATEGVGELHSLSSLARVLCGEANARFLATLARRQRYTREAAHSHQHNELTYRALHSTIDAAPVRAQRGRQQAVRLPLIISGAALCCRSSFARTQASAALTAPHASQAASSVPVSADGPDDEPIDAAHVQYLYAVVPADRVPDILRGGLDVLLPSAAAFAAQTHEAMRATMGPRPGAACGGGDDRAQDGTAAAMGACAVTDAEWCAAGLAPCSPHAPSRAPPATEGVRVQSPLVLSLAPVVDVEHVADVLSRGHAAVTLTNSLPLALLASRQAGASYTVVVCSVYVGAALRVPDHVFQPRPAMSPPASLSTHTCTSPLCAAVAPTLAPCVLPFHDTHTVDDAWFLCPTAAPGVPASVAACLPSRHAPGSPTPTPAPAPIWPPLHPLSSHISPQLDTAATALAHALVDPSAQLAAHAAHTHTLTLAQDALHPYRTSALAASLLLRRDPPHAAFRPLPRGAAPPSTNKYTARARARQAAEETRATGSLPAQSGAGTSSGDASPSYATREDMHMLDALVWYPPPPTSTPTSPAGDESGPACGACMALTRPFVLFLRDPALVVPQFLVMGECLPAPDLCLAQTLSVSSTDTRTEADRAYVDAMCTVPSSPSSSSSSLHLTCMAAPLALASTLSHTALPLTAVPCAGALPLPAGLPVAPLLAALLRPHVFSPLERMHPLAAVIAPPASQPAHTFSSAPSPAALILAQVRRIATDAPAARVSTSYLADLAPALPALASASLAHVPAQTVWPLAVAVAAQLPPLPLPASTLVLPAPPPALLMLITTVAAAVARDMPPGPLLAHPGYAFCYARLSVQLCTDVLLRLLYTPMQPSHQPRDCGFARTLLPQWSDILTTTATAAGTDPAADHPSARMPCALCALMEAYLRELATRVVLIALADTALTAALPVGPTPTPASAPTALGALALGGDSVPGHTSDSAARVLRVLAARWEAEFHAQTRPAAHAAEAGHAGVMLLTPWALPLVPAPAHPHLPALYAALNQHLLAVYPRRAASLAHALALALVAATLRRPPTPRLPRAPSPRLPQSSLTLALQTAHAHASALAPSVSGSAALADALADALAWDPCATSTEHPDVSSAHARVQECEPVPRPLLLFLLSHAYIAPALAPTPSLQHCARVLVATPSSHGRVDAAAGADWNATPRSPFARIADMVSDLLPPPPGAAVLTWLRMAMEHAEHSADTARGDDNSGQGASSPRNSGRSSDDNSGARAVAGAQDAALVDAVLRRLNESDAAHPRPFSAVDLLSLVWELRVDGRALAAAGDRAVERLLRPALHSGTLERALTHMRSLRKCVLRGVALQSLAPLRACSGLLSLDVSDNALTTLATLPAALPALTHLRVTHNQLRDVSVLTRMQLPRLAHIDLAHNHLCSLAPLALMPTLTVVAAPANHLSALAQFRVLGALRNLAALDISHNPVTAAPALRATHAYVLRCLPWLRTLDGAPVQRHTRGKDSALDEYLVCTRVVRAAEEARRARAGDGLTTEIVVNARGCLCLHGCAEPDVRTIGRGVDADAGEAATLIGPRQCPLSTLPALHQYLAAAPDFRAVSVLDLSGLRLRSVAFITQHAFPSLRTLILDHNLLTDLSSLQPLPKLTVLRINHNSIACANIAAPSTAPAWPAEAPTGMLRLVVPQLEVLEAAGNRLVAPSQLGVAGLSRLVALGLEDNGLQRVDGLVDLPALQHLVLNKNKLKRLPHDCMHALTALRELQVEDNLLVAAGGLVALPQLVALFLANNRFASLQALEPLLTAHVPDPSAAATGRPETTSGLCELSLAGTPLARLPHYRAALILALPGLRVLDGAPVTEGERAAARAMLGSEEEQPVPGLGVPGNRAGMGVAGLPNPTAAVLFGGNMHVSLPTQTLTFAAPARTRLVPNNVFREPAPSPVGSMANADVIVLGSGHYTRGGGRSQPNHALRVMTGTGVTNVGTSLAGGLVGVSVQPQNHYVGSSSLGMGVSGVGIAIQSAHAMRGNNNVSTVPPKRKSMNYR